MLPAGGANVGSTYDAAFRVGHACKDAKTTTAVVVDLPKGFQFKEAVPRSGWTLTTSANNSTVRWTADSAASAPSASEKTGVHRARRAAQRIAQTLYFPVQQMCDVGQAQWTQIPSKADAGAKLEFPAARSDVLADNVASVDARDMWVRAAVPGQSGTGAFVTLQAPQGAKLVAVSSPAAGVVEIHEMKMDGEVMRMRAILCSTCLRVRVSASRPVATI